MCVSKSDPPTLKHQWNSSHLPLEASVKWLIIPPKKKKKNLEGKIMFQTKISGDNLPDFFKGKKMKRRTRLFCLSSNFLRLSYISCDGRVLLSQFPGFVWNFNVMGLFFVASSHVSEISSLGASCRFLLNSLWSIAQSCTWCWFYFSSGVKSTPQHEASVIKIPFPYFL